jgi:hypothetical protein
VAFLEGVDGDQAQGFYFGRPIPASQIAADIFADFQHTNLRHIIPLGADGKLRAAK